MRPLKHLKIDGKVYSLPTGGGDTSAIETALTATDTATYTTDYGVKVVVYKYGPLCMIDIDGTPSNLTTGWKTLCTIDEQFRPPFDLPYGIGFTQGNNYSKYLVDVKANGTVRINPLNAAPSGFVRYMVTYPLALSF
jgi:hypothetical protein